MTMEPDTIPEWLDKDYVQSLLRENEHGGIVLVKDIEVRSAVGKGENYASRMHRVTVNLTRAGKPETRHLVIKSLPTSEFLRKFILEGGIFEKETKMYMETIPAMYQLLQNKSSNNNNNARDRTVSCKCYKTSLPYTIVMDDLQPRGYKMAPRHVGLDLQHATLAVRALGRLHALSVGLAEKDPHSMDAYAEAMYVPEKTEMIRQFIEPSINILATCVSRWEGYERFGDKLRNIAWAERTIRLFKKRTALWVLNHGDMWVNNMMFKYSQTGQVEDVKLVDFQIVRYSSPAMDIQYFMYTSPGEEARTEHWDTLLGEYHEEFVAILREIGSNPEVLGLEALKKEVEDNALFGLLTACTILPVVLANTDDAPDLDQVKDYDELGGEEISKEFQKAYNGQRYRNAFQTILLHFESIGVL